MIRPYRLWTRRARLAWHLHKFVNRLAHRLHPHATLQPQARWPRLWRLNHAIARIWIREYLPDDRKDAEATRPKTQALS